MGVNGREAACAFMILLQNKPRPRTRFSPNSSGIMCLTLDTLILLIRPLMDFFKASQAMRWYSLLDLSVICDWRARSLAGGMYVPPDRMFRSFSYSALAAACFSSSVIGFLVASCFSRDRNRSCSMRSRSSGSRFSSRLRVPLWAVATGGDLLRRGEGDREGGDRFLRFEGPGEYASGGGGVGRRTADRRSADMLGRCLVYSTISRSCRDMLAINAKGRTLEDIRKDAAGGGSIRTLFAEASNNSSFSDWQTKQTLVT